MPQLRYVLVTLLLFVLATRPLFSDSSSAQTIPKVHLPIVSLGISSVPTTFATRTPTHTPTPTDTPTITPTPTLTPTLTPTPGPTGEVVVLSSTAFTPTADSLYIVGEIQNNTNRNVQAVQINAILRERSGMILTGEDGRALVTVLEPGDIAPFRVVMQSGAGAWMAYELTVNWSESSDPPVGLDIMSREGYFGQADAFHVRGTMRNQTSEVRDAVTVVVTAYDETGAVVGADFSATNPATLQPGQEISYTVEIPFWAGQPEQSTIDLFKVAAYSN